MQQEQKTDTPNRQPQREGEDAPAGQKQSGGPATVAPGNAKIEGPEDTEELEDRDAKLRSPPAAPARKR